MSSNASLAGYFSGSLVRIDGPLLVVHDSINPVCEIVVWQVLPSLAHGYPLLAVLRSSVWLFTRWAPCNAILVLPMLADCGWSHMSYPSFLHDFVHVHLRVVVLFLD